MKTINIKEGEKTIQLNVETLKTVSSNIKISEIKFEKNLLLEITNKCLNSLIDFKGTVLFTSQDHEFTNTIANRIIELTPKGIIDKLMTYDEYLANEGVQSLRAQMYS